MDWLGKMLNLPQEFLFENKGHGGGVIQVFAIYENIYGTWKFDHHR